MEEKLNIDLDIICPCCGKPRYFLKFYCDKVINVCGLCGYWEEI